MDISAGGPKPVDIGFGFAQCTFPADLLLPKRSAVTHCEPRYFSTLPLHIGFEAKTTASILPVAERWRA
jgi:hypothetical protein